MSKIYEEKERFVRTSLKSLLFDVDKDILDVYYQHDKVTNEEVVTVIYINDSTYKIRVTGDSLLAIVNDVTKKLLA